MKKFKELLKEVKGKTAVFTFGRMNPPSIGHELVIRKVLAVAEERDATPFIFLSRSHDKKNNPLTYEQKVKYLTLGVSESEKYIQNNELVKDPFDAINELAKSGYKHIIMITGEDRVAEFQENVSKYIGHPDLEKRINIESFHVVSAGKRIEESSTIEGVSSSKLRKAVQDNDFTYFQSSVPTGLSIRFAKEMFDLLKNKDNVLES